MSRTLQLLPVADAICSPGRPVLFPEQGDHQPYWGADLNEALLSCCTRVNFGVAPHQSDIHRPQQLGSPAPRCPFGFRDSAATPR
jgi:hypothetical protein